MLLTHIFAWFPAAMHILASIFNLIIVQWQHVDVLLVGTGLGEEHCLMKRVNGDCKFCYS